MQIPSRAKQILGFIFLISLFTSTHAFAGPYADALGKAMVARATQSEKVALVRWFFVAMSLHPEVKNLSAITDQQRVDANREVAKMFESLLTEKCVEEARDAIKYEGSSAIQSSFQLFGQVAARELFGHPSVAAGLADLQKYIDSDKVNKILDPPKPAASDPKEK
jgi:hypothetical protein